MGLIIVVLAAITLVAGGAAPVKADWNKAASDQTLAQVAVASPMMSSRKAPIASPYTYPSQQQFTPSPTPSPGPFTPTPSPGPLRLSPVRAPDPSPSPTSSPGPFTPTPSPAPSPTPSPAPSPTPSPAPSDDFKGFDAGEFINFFIILSAGAAVIGGSVMGLRIILAYGLGSGYALSQAFQSLLVALVGMGMLMFSEQSVEWLDKLQLDRLIRTFDDRPGIWPIIRFLTHLGYVITVLGFGWNSLMITLDALFNASTEPSPVVFQRILAMTIAFLILRFATNIAKYVTDYLINPST
jgi:hypothetical protein